MPLPIARTEQSLSCENSVTAMCVPPGKRTPARAPNSGNEPTMVGLVLLETSMVVMPVKDSRRGKSALVLQLLLEAATEDVLWLMVLVWW